VLLRAKEWRAYLGIDVVSLGAGLTAVRNYPLFIILSLKETDLYVRRLVSKLPAKLTRGQAGVLGVLLAVLAGSAVAGAVDVYNLPLDREARFPQAAVAYLQQHPCEGTVYNNFNDGGYLLWKLPGEKVNIDGRMPSWKSDGVSYLDTYLDVQSKPEVRRAVFEKYAVKCVVADTATGDEAMVEGLRNEGWKAVSTEGTFVLLVR